MQVNRRGIGIDADQAVEGTGKCFRKTFNMNKMNSPGGKVNHAVYMMQGVRKMYVTGLHVLQGDVAMDGGHFTRGGALYGHGQGHGSAGPQAIEDGPGRSKAAHL